jgi:hypothetical protein
MRGPWIAIALVIAVVGMDLATYRRWIRLRWPVVAWTMYERKAWTEPTVSYRRFVAYRADGTRAPISLGEAFGFLDGAYQLDKGLDESRAGFLLVCLEALRKNLGTDVVGLGHEIRSWRYEEQSYDAHLAAPPDDEFRLGVVESPARELRLSIAAKGSILKNGSFLKVRLKSGRPKEWELDGRWFGQGTDLVTPDRSLLLGAGPAPQTATQLVFVPPGITRLRLVALGRTRGPGAAVELVVTSPTMPPNTARTEVPYDGAWHAVEVSTDVPQGAEVRVVLRTSGAADVYYDDVALYPSGS